MAVSLWGCRLFAAEARERVEKREERGQECPRSLQSAPLPNDETSFQAGFCRIFTNVTLHRSEMLRTADEAVKVIGLPEGIQGAEAGFVDETAGNTFPALPRVRQGFVGAEGEEDMDVIGHDGVAPEVVALAVEMMEAVGDDLSEAWITQGAGAVGGVEVFVELVGEVAVVAGFSDVVPWWWIRGEVGLAGKKPVIEEFTRQRIGEMEGDEDRLLALLPMRQLVSRLFDVPSRIEELHDSC